MTTPSSGSRRERRSEERVRPGARTRLTAGSVVRFHKPRSRTTDAASTSAPRTSFSARRRVLSTLTMMFVAAVLIVTCVPINALLNPADLAIASPAQTVSRMGAQEMAEVTGGADVALDRDSYTVTSQVQKLKATSAGRTPQFVNNTGGAIQWPFAIGVPMSDQFGPRVLCDGCEVTMHRGVDFLPGRGAPIQIIADGVVRYVEESDDGLGVHVIVDHQIDGQLVSSVYCHMEFGSVAVSPGQSVKVGQLVGTTGDTGFAFGPHLHFEIRLNGTENVDPVAWLQAHAS